MNTKHRQAGLAKGRTGITSNGEQAAPNEIADHPGCPMIARQNVATKAENLQHEGSDSKAQAVRMNPNPSEGRARQIAESFRIRANIQIKV